MIQREKAELLLRLQQPGSSLLLPNAWDAASARLFEEAGFPALGTTSAGIAEAQALFASRVRLDLASGPQTILFDQEREH